MTEDQPASGSRAIMGCLGCAIGGVCALLLVGMVIEAISAPGWGARSFAVGIAVPFAFLALYGAELIVRAVAPELGSRSQRRFAHLRALGALVVGGTFALAGAVGLVIELATPRHHPIFVGRAIAGIALFAGLAVYGWRTLLQRVK